MATPERALNPSINGHGSDKHLALWIKKGWKHPEGRKIQNTYLAYDNGQARIILRTLAFALIAKEEGLDNGVKALERELPKSDNYLGALAKILDVPISLIQRVEKLERRGEEGDFVGKSPLEIADILGRQAERA